MIIGSVWMRNLGVASVGAAFTVGDTSLTLGTGQGAAIFDGFPASGKVTFIRCAPSDLTPAYEVLLRVTGISGDVLTVDPTPLEDSYGGALAVGDTVKVVDTVELLAQLLADATGGHSSGGAAFMWPVSGSPNGTLTDVAPHNMTSAALPSPYSVTDSGSYAPSWRAFDGVWGNEGQVWIGIGTSGLWISIDLGAAKTLGSYGIQANADANYVTRCPQGWVFEGSNDGTTWTTLDSRSTQTGWAPAQLRTFAISGTPAAYQHYRISISANNGDSSWTEIGEIYLYLPVTAVFTGGSDGDFVIDFAGKAFYGPKSGSSWPYIGALV